MLKLFKGLLALVAILTFTGDAQALPAAKGIFGLKRPDGTELRVQLLGDEHFHCYLSEDGYLLAERDGDLYFAVPDEDCRPVASALRASNPEERTTRARELLAGVDASEMLQAMAMSAADSRRRGPGLFVGTTFPSLGHQKAIVILVEYQDEKFRTADPYGYFSRMLGQEGFSDMGGTGSCRDYFVASSGGRFQPEFDVFGPVTLPHPRAYYGANVGNRDGVNASMMVVDACDALDAQVDFSEYDRDGDGVIDNVFLFYAGLGESCGGGPDSVWPHSATAPYGRSYDGKVLRTYGCANEWVPRGTPSGRPDGIGTFCHEFAHVLGLPDLYVTQTVTPAPFTPGAWTLLDQGCYSNNACTPPLLGLFSRYALGWWDPVVLDGSSDISLKPYADCGEGYLIRTPNPDEYFLVENRQRCGWDSFIPGHGMLVWHVDYEPGAWSQHAVNNNAAHQHVDILEADGILNEATRAGDSFPGTAGVTSLTATTTPGLVAWSGTPIQQPITDIAELPDGTVTFKVGGGAAPAAPVEALDAADVTPRSFQARWTESPEAESYRLAVFAEDDSPVAGYNFRQVVRGSCAEVVGLEPDTRYYYTVTVETGHSTSPQSNRIEVTTLPLTHRYVIPTGLVASDVTDSGFKAAWDPVDGADSYQVSIERRELSGATEISESFDDKTALWPTNSSTFYSSASYTGATAPSLRLTDGNYVATPVLPGGEARSFSFWHRGHATDASSRLLVEVYAHGCWALWQSFPATADKGGRTIVVNSFPPTVDALRLSFVDPSGTGTIYVDDFKATYGGRETRTPLAPVAVAAPGTDIAGLAPGSEYFWTVTALQGSEESLPSAPCFVRTGGVGSVAAVVADEVRIAVEGRNIVAPGPARLYDLGGRLLGSSSRGRLQAPAPGAYLVRCGSSVAKIIIMQ